MKKNILFILSIIIVKFSYSQTITRKAQPVAGSYFSNGNISLSATIGETFNATLGNNTNMITQGYQQPESIDTGVYINLTAFIEGYYVGNSKMQSLFNTPGVLTEKTVSDIIQVALHYNTPPYDLAFVNNALINTDGTARVLFPASAIGSSYYVVLKHRNSLETWSASPVNIATLGASYNFSNAANKAFGNNLSDMGNGVFAMYSGDITQDGSIDFNDYPALDIASNDGILGYDANDLNGDASVDFNDYPLLDINSNNGVLALRP
jgi:hypothetical protein